MVMMIINFYISGFRYMVINILWISWISKVLVMWFNIVLFCIMILGIGGVIFMFKF